MISKRFFTIQTARYCSVDFFNLLSPLSLCPLLLYVNRTVGYETLYNFAISFNDHDFSTKFLRKATSS